jgi:hypothetical protein
MNMVKSKDVRNVEREKEYLYPPLPNLESAKQAFLKKRLEDMRKKVSLQPNEYSDSKVNISVDSIGLQN